MDKIKKNFLLPPELVQSFESLASRVSGKEKWTIFAAAHVAFLRLSDEVQNDYINAVRQSESPGRSIRELLSGPAKPKPPPFKADYSQDLDLLPGESGDGKDAKLAAKKEKKPKK